MAKIAVVGSYGVGLTMTVPRLPAPGETLVGGEFDLGPGGKGSNQAIAACRLGANVELFAAVGPDQFGSDARELWRREGVGSDHVLTVSRHTMVGFILVEPGGENRIAIAPGALEELTPEHVRAFERVIEWADVCVAVLEIPTETVVAALHHARKAGVTTILNPAPAKELPEDVWASIDYLTPNLTEAAGMLGLGSHQSPQELIRGLKSRFGGTIVLTMGEDGALLSEPKSDDPLHIPAKAANRVVDSTGAGDAFNGAFAVAIAEGRSAEAAVRFGCLAGSHACQTLGVIGSLPYRSDLVAEPLAENVARR